jgi:hypothetical protein
VRENRMATLQQTDANQIFSKTSLRRGYCRETIERLQLNTSEKRKEKEKSTENLPD